MACRTYTCTSAHIHIHARTVPVRLGVHCKNETHGDERFYKWDMCAYLAGCVDKRGGHLGGCQAVHDSHVYTQR